jgi:hypothetical protein
MLMRTAFLVAFTIAASFPAGAAGNEIQHYGQTHGAASYEVSYTIVRTGDVIELSSSGGSVTDAVRWKLGVGTIWWKQVDPASRIEIEATRVGDVVHVTGTHKGSPIVRDVKLDGAPWYQVFGPLIEELLPGLAGQREFWVVDPQDLASHRMLARRAGQERVRINGTGVDSVKIHFSPAGALAPFWGADFWYRPEDSVYLYSRLPENGGLTISTIADPAR